MSGLEIVLLLFFLGGENDFVSALDPADYFKSRKIKTTTAQLVELVTAEPKTAKAQIQQLLALRMLADKANDIRKGESYKTVYKAVEAVAKGQKAQDLQGFARTYAQKTYQALGAKVKIEPSKRPTESVRKDAFKWFPKNATFIGSVDTRGISADNKVAQEFVQKHFFSAIPQQGKDYFYQQLEKLGNVRIDRLSFAWVEDTTGGRNGKIFMRFTGKANHDWFVEVMKEQRQFTLEKSKRRFRGRKISLFSGRWGPNLGVVGDSDLIFAGYERGQNGVEVVKECLKIRSSKAPNVLAGPLGKKLAKISEKTSALMAGTPPLEFQREIGRGLLAIQVRNFPNQFVMELSVEKKGYAVKTTGEFGTAQAAKNFVEDANNAVKISIAGLQQVKNNPPRFGPQFPNWGKMIDEAVGGLKSVNFAAKGSSVNGTGKASKSLVKYFTQFGGTMMGMQYRYRAVPRPGGVEIKGF